MSIRQREIVCFVLTALVSFLLWYCSPTLFHVPEPALQWPYLWSLLVLGAVARLGFRATPKLIYGAVVTGQLGAGILRAGSVAAFCVPCHLVWVLGAAMAAGFGAWVVSLRR